MHEQEKNSSLKVIFNFSNFADLPIDNKFLQYIVLLSLIMQ